MLRRSGVRCSQLLWNWAAKHTKAPAFQSAVSPQHQDTEIFIDSIHRASSLVRKSIPLIYPMMKLFSRGREMLPLDQVQMLEHWNTPDEFLDGAEAVYQAMFVEMVKPEGTSLPSNIREAMHSDVKKWFDEERADVAKKMAKYGTPEASDAAAELEEPEFVEVCARFEDLSGAASLDMIRSMTPSNLSTYMEKQEIFAQDAFRNTKLNLEVAIVCGLQHKRPDPLKTLLVRRADRITLSCDFNLRSGIDSAFMLTAAETMAVEVTPWTEE